MTTSEGAHATEPDPMLLLAGLGRQQVRPTTAHEFVRESLRRGILTGLLPGGSQLGQSQIAESLGVSTTPVREALRDLASEGLIDFDAYRTASVHLPTAEELNEVYNLRQMLESYAVSTMVPLVTEQRLKEAERIQDLMESETDIAEWLILNAEFHSILTGACQSPKLENFLATLRASVALYVGMAIRTDPNRQIESNKEHRQLLAACRNRDISRAVEVTRAHMDPARDLIESALLAPRE